MSILHRAASVGGIVACLISGRAGATPPSADQARDAVATYEQGTWRYQGRTDAPALSGRLLLSFRDVSGRVAGEALLLTPDRRLLSASPVSGRRLGTECHLRLALSGMTQQLDGICSPSALGGTLVEERPRRGALFELLAWWDDRRTPGEAWLSAGGDL